MIPTLMLFSDIVFHLGLLQFVTEKARNMSECEYGRVCARASQQNYDVCVRASQIKL